ncbi:RluA family pseudouridine synthase [Buchnera aphidicola]|uniref:RluA family pseudouridine synthase n=1 Tax=Buchnera aphidicola TaxID=9 RepID=UPI00346472B1
MNKMRKIFFKNGFFLHIVYEDQYIFIINKPKNIVIHSGRNVNSTTLMDMLLIKYPFLYHVPRAGIVHRLDKNTTGLLIIAKDTITYYSMVTLIKNRMVIREYDAFVFGNLISSGSVNLPIIKKIRKNIRMVVHNSGKISVTHYKIIQRFKYYTHVHLKLETGRTHQIRLHMLNIKKPILGDPLYQLRNCFPLKINTNVLNKLKLFSRQALHASHIKFFHPIINVIVDCYLSLPKDMIEIMKYL